MALLLSDNFSDTVGGELGVGLCAFSVTWILDGCSIDEPFEVSYELGADDKFFLLCSVSWVDLGNFSLEDRIEGAIRTVCKAAHLRFTAEEEVIKCCKELPVVCNGRVCSFDAV
jgi:hypothetical protein